MVQFINSTTGESVNVFDIKLVNGVYVSDQSDKKEKGQKFITKYSAVLTEHRDESGAQYFTINEGWEAVAKIRKQRQPRQPKVEKEKVEQPQPDVIDIQQPVEVELPKADEVKEVADELRCGVVSFDSLKAELATKYGALGADVFEAVLKVAYNIQPKQPKVEEKKAEPKQVQHVVKVADLPEVKLPEGQEVSPLFDEVLAQVVNDRAIGRFPWLYGPAGSGKSTLAAQVAEALGLPFYSVSSLQQKYELEGYSDAVGEFVQTSFYKAMSEGGVFCFDEMSTTSGEVQVAFNTAAAQLLYNFPKIGMVKAHPDFHIIACDNSTGRGGDSRYISRYQLDASTLDRYTFIEVGYTEAHDVKMAQGDKELVKFMKAMREVLDNSNTTYLATPRASRSIKVQQQIGADDVKALWLGLCSGWNKQDIRTFASSLRGSGRYFSAFCEVVTRYC